MEVFDQQSIWETYLFETLQSMSKDFNLVLSLQYMHGRMNNNERGNNNIDFPITSWSPTNIDICTLLCYAPIQVLYVTSSLGIVFPNN